LAIFSLVLAFFAGLPELNRGYWSFALVLPALPLFLMCIILSKCPESPKFLYMSCGKREQAQQVLNEFFDKKQATSMFVSLIKENSQTKVCEICELYGLCFLGATNKIAKNVCTFGFSVQNVHCFTDYPGPTNDRNFHCVHSFWLHIQRTFDN
jgi:hypothetical protein